MIEDHFGMYLVLIPHCMTEILAKECKSEKSTVLVLGTVHSRDNYHLHSLQRCNELCMHSVMYYVYGNLI